MIGVDTAGIAEQLGRAADTATAIPQVAAETGLDVDGAYAVQTALVQRRLDLPEAGEPLASFTDAVRAVAPAIELIDSRYANFTFSLPDVIADNTSAAAFVVGPWSPVPDGLDNLGVLLEIDGRVAQVGSTAAILGDPRRALDEGIRLAGRHGVRLREGWLFLAGAATAAVPMRAGAHVRVVVEKLGAASLRAAS